MRRFERRDLKDRIPVFDVVDQAFLDGAAELLPERLVAVGVSGQEILERRPSAAGGEGERSLRVVRAVLVFLGLAGSSE